MLKDPGLEEGFSPALANPPTTSLELEEGARPATVRHHRAERPLVLTSGPPPPVFFGRITSDRAVRFIEEIPPELIRSEGFPSTVSSSRRRQLVLPSRPLHSFQGEPPYPTGGG